MVDALVTVYAVTGAGAVGSIATKDLNTGAATWVDATFSAKGGNAPQSSDSWLFFAGLTGGLAKPLSPRANTAWDAVAYSQVPDSLANGRCLSHSTEDTTIGALGTATYVVAAAMELRSSGNAPAVVPVEGVTLAPGTASLQPGQTQQFVVTVSPSNATNPAVEWRVGS